MGNQTTPATRWKKNRRWKMEDRPLRTEGYSAVANVNPRNHFDPLSATFHPQFSGAGGFTICSMISGYWSATLRVSLGSEDRS